MDAAGRLDGASIDVVTRDEDVPTGEGLRVHRGITPRSEELRRLYNDADVFALPTYADAVPNVVVEAMAAGLPVVATDVGAVREMVGDAGVVVPRGDVDALAAALARCTATLRGASVSARGPGSVWGGTTSPRPRRGSWRSG